MRLKGKTAIVTGGSRGIGRSITLRLAQEGANVVVVGTTPEALDDTVARVEANGGRALGIPTDISDFAAVRNMVERAEAAFGQIDILVNNAGGSARQKMSLFCDSDEETWDYVLGVNLKGVLYTCRAVINPMLARKSGVIINIGSVAGMIGTAGQADYSASKGAVIAFTHALAKETAAAGVRINCVSPGPTENDNVKRMPAEHKQSPVFQQLCQSTGFGRFAEPEEVASLVAYLASDEASFITGQNYAVCGLMNLGITGNLGG